jgi:hypothetical protein
MSKFVIITGDESINPPYITHITAPHEFITLNLTWSCTTNEYKVIPVAMYPNKSIIITYRLPTYLHLLDSAIPSNASILYSMSSGESSKISST